MALTLNGTTGLSGIAGSAGTPALQGNNDTNTGYFFAADTLGLSTGGNERLRITSAGLVGINCIPNKQLEVKGTDVAFRLLSTVATGRIGMEFYDTSAQKGYFGYASSSNDEMSIQQNEAADLWFYVNGDERLRIKSDGKIGIANNAPAVELDIKATSPEIRLTCSDNALNQGDTIGQIGWYTTDPTTPGGAGTVSYINTFSANGNGADYSTKIFNRDGSGGGSTYIQLGNAAGSITFGTNTAGNAGTQKLVINSSGNVGIGTAAPSTKLSLEGSAGSTSHGILIGAKNAGGIRGVIEVHTAADTTGFNLSRTGGGSDTDIVLLKNDGDIGVVECRNSSNTSKVRLKAGALSYLHSEDSRGHQELLELKHINTSTTGDGPALLFNGYYSNAEWKYAKISSENSGSGYGAKLKIHVHPSNSNQGANLVEALSITGNGSSGANVTITDGNLIVASGHGIDFSATSDGPSQGNETLDDYERGTYSPQGLSWNGSAWVNVTFDSISRYGRYTKIGGYVHVQGYFSNFHVDSSFDNTLAGIDLPFAPINAGGHYSVGVTTHSTAFSSAGYTTFFVNSSGSSHMYSMQENTTSYNTWSGSSGRYVMFQASYMCE